MIKVTLTFTDDQTMKTVAVHGAFEVQDATIHELGSFAEFMHDGSTGEFADQKLSELRKMAQSQPASVLPN